MGVLTFFLYNTFCLAIASKFSSMMPLFLLFQTCLRCLWCILQTYLRRTQRHSSFNKWILSILSNLPNWILMVGSVMTSYPLRLCPVKQVPSKIISRYFCLKSKSKPCISLDSPEASLETIRTSAIELIYEYS